MQTLVYDGSFEGWLTAVFDVFEYKLTDVDIVPDSTAQNSLFGESITVISDSKKAERVWNGMRKYLSSTAMKEIFKAFLSEQKGCENQLLAYARYTFQKKKSVEQDFSHPAVLYVSQTARKVHREKHRMEAFVRFQRTTDGLFFSTIEPDFNVLPLIRKHFADRYADQRWLIYDVKRKYGLYYDLERVDTVSVDIGEKQNLENGCSFTLDVSEGLYQHLWQQYFKSVNIASRKNMKLHIRHMPLRYWKYLVEKQPAVG